MPRLRLETAAQLVALTGANGAGKTNLLEAISLLAPGRGLRGVSLRRAGPAGRRRRLGRRGGDRRPSTARSASAPPGAASRTRRGRQPPGGDRRRGAEEFRRAGRLHAAALAHARPWTGCSPGRGSDRRRFLDRLVTAFDPEHAAPHHGVREGDARAQPAAGGDPPDAAWLSSLEAHMAEAAVAISAARLVGLEALQTHIGEAPGDQLLPLGGSGRRGRDRGPGGRRNLPCKSRTNIVGFYAIRAVSTGRRGAPSGPAPQRSRGGPRAEADGGGAVLHRRAEGAADRPRPGPGAGGARRVPGVAPILLLDEVAAHLDRARRKSLLELWRPSGHRAG